MECRKPRADSTSTRKLHITIGLPSPPEQTFNP